MTHLREGTILTIRDGGLVDAEARAHVETCDACSGVLEATTARREAVARALDALDGGPPLDLVEAKAEVRRKLDARRGASRGNAPGLHRSLGRAAVLLLLASGAVYALPNSSLRSWIRGEEAVEATRGGAAPASEGIELPVPSGGLAIVVVSADVGQRIHVSWADGQQASVVASAGSRYDVSSAGLEVDVAPGDVRIEVPRGPEPITLEVNGRTVLRSVGGVLDVRGDVVSRDADGIVFTAGQG